MKFSEIDQQEWDSLKPYLDTCILPVTGLSGKEQPWEAVTALEHLRDALDTIEIPFKGRVVTYPAMHYTNLDKARLSELIDQVSKGLKEAGFKYVIVITADPSLDLTDCVEADLVLRPEASTSENVIDQQTIASQVQALWNS